MNQQTEIRTRIQNILPKEFAEYDWRKGYTIPFNNNLQSPETIAMLENFKQFNIEPIIKGFPLNPVLSKNQNVYLKTDIWKSHPEPILIVTRSKDKPAVRSAQLVAFNIHVRGNILYIGGSFRYTYVGSSWRSKPAVKSMTVKRSIVAVQQGSEPYYRDNLFWI